MIITERTKRAIPFRPNDAKRAGEGCFYLDHIVWLTMVHTANHKIDDATRPIPERGRETSPPVQIGAQCWVGVGVCILPGVRIGEGCVVGAASVLTGDLDAFSVAVGNPAKPVRNRR